MPTENSNQPYVASVPIVVSDKQRSKEWYVNKLGLSLTSDEDHWVTVGGGRGTDLHLCQASENMPEPIPLEPGPSGIVFAISGDFVAECKKLEALGIEFSHQPEEAPWGWFATIRDPDGNEHYLCPAP